MDDFNAELLASQERAEIFNLEERLCPECGTRMGEYMPEDRYILHGVLSRLLAVHNTMRYKDLITQATHYKSVVQEIINTLTSYISQS